MSGRDFQNKPVLAVVKPLRTANSLVERPDPVLVDRPLTEDSTDLETLFQQHHDRVFRTAYRVTGSAADAEDVLQTVFLRVARGPETASVAENPQAYFARAAVNASLDLLRSRKRSKAVALDDVENHPRMTAFISKQTPETHREDRELRDLIREAVSRLGPTAAQMFALRYLEGYDNGEIGRLMGTSALVVGVTLHRARARLRKEIGSYLQKHQT
jgi:RNA polymerase sigma-70 factor (ECF subfamily)